VPLFGGRVDGPTPAALVEAIGCDAQGCEGGEEDTVGVDVVTEAVDENEASFGLADGLVERSIGIWRVCEGVAGLFGCYKGESIPSMS